MLLLDLNGNASFIQICHQRSCVRLIWQLKLAFQSEPDSASGIKSVHYDHPRNHRNKTRNHVRECKFKNWHIQVRNFIKTVGGAASCQMSTSKQGTRGCCRAWNLAWIIIGYATRTQVRIMWNIHEHVWISNESRLNYRSHRVCISSLIITCSCIMNWSRKHPWKRAHCYEYRHWGQTS